MGVWAGMKGPDCIWYTSSGVVPTVRTQGTLTTMLPLGFFVPGLSWLCGPSATQVFVSSPEETREEGGAGMLNLRAGR